VRIFLVILFSLALVLPSPAAQCSATVVSVSANNGQLALVNTSGKTIVHYVLVDPTQHSHDGSPRLYTGAFSPDQGIQTGKSFSFGSGSPDQITIDYVRFADGSSCGNGTTKEAKAAGAH
jgi:hypothetical protein